MIYVKKLNGRLEKYDESKLRRSLLNSGADKKIIDKIIVKVNKILYNGIETRKLFRFVFKEFKKYQPYLSSRYDLKNAILRLGTEGYPFEVFVAKIFQKKSYSIKLNQIVRGKYIKHEIDIFAEKGEEKLMVECKHHIKPWLGCKIQTALYVYARFIDVKKSFTFPMLITNTKFSPQVITYSKGVGLRLMGWKFPKKDSLEHNIERFKLYPVTMLSKLNKKSISELLKLNILLISELSAMDGSKIARILKIPELKANEILKESDALCKCD